MHAHAGNVSRRSAPAGKPTERRGTGPVSESPGPPVSGTAVDSWGGVRKGVMTTMQREHSMLAPPESNEAGFTLIELMMVVFIIAILIAVLIPMFVGATTRAKDRAMQSSLRNALTAAKIVLQPTRRDYTQATSPDARLRGACELRFVERRDRAERTEHASRSTPLSTSYIVFGGLSKSGDVLLSSPTTQLGRERSYAERAARAAAPRDGARCRVTRAGERPGRPSSDHR